MEKQLLTLEQITYLYRGTLEEMRGAELPGTAKLETVRLFAQYLFALHGAESRPTSRDICLAALKRMAKLWEYYLDDKPDKLTQELAVSIMHRQQIIAAVA